MMRLNTYLFDAFISHAVEDKIAIANELNERLTDAGLCVWYSGKELNAGGDLRQTIDDGLDQSRFGIAVLTPTYLKKSYTRKEYYHLLAKEKDGTSVILTVIHDITPAEIIAVDPEMARKYLIDSSRGMDYVVKELLRVILPERDRRRRRATVLKSFLMFLIAAVAFVLGYLAYAYHNHRPSVDVIEAAITSRVNSLQRTVEDSYLNEFRAADAAIALSRALDSVRSGYDGVNARYRNEYFFSNGFVSVSSRTKVWDTLKVDPETLVVASQLGFPDAEIFFRKSLPSEPAFAVLSKDNVTYQYDMAAGSFADVYTVVVAYTNPIRYVHLQLYFPPEGGIKRRKFSIHGLLPRERYEFVVGDDGDWVLARVF